MEWLLVLQLLNPAAELPTVTTQTFASRAVCERQASELGRALGVSDGSKTRDGGEVMLQCIAKVEKRVTALAKG